MKWKPKKVLKDEVAFLKAVAKEGNLRDIAYAAKVSVLIAGRWLAELEGRGLVESRIERRSKFGEAGRLWALK